MSSPQDLKNEAERINKIGDQLMKQKKFSEAIIYYTNSVELANQAGDSKKAADYSKELEEAVARRGKELNDAGDALFKQKKYFDAVKTYYDAYDFLKKAGEKWINKYGKEFLSELNKAKCAYAKNTKQPEAENFAKAKNWEAATSKYDEILNYISPDVDANIHSEFKKASCKVYENWAQEVNNQGDAAYKAKKFEEAIPLYAESVRLIEKSDNDGKKKNFRSELSKAFSEQSQIINNIGDKLMKEKKYMQAAEVYRQSVEMAKEAKNQKLIDSFTSEMEKAYAAFAQSINNRGDDLYKQGNYEEASQIYLNSVNIAKEANKKSLVDDFTKEYNKAMEKWAEEWNSKGDTAFNSKKWEEAIEDYKKSVEIIGKTGNKGKLENYTKELVKGYLECAKAINFEGDICFKAGKYQEAYNFYDKSVQYAELSGDKGKTKDFRKERDRAMEKLK